MFGSFYLHVFFPVLIFVSHTGSIRPNNIRSHPVNRCRSEGRVRMWLGQHVEELFKFQEVRKYVLVSELYLSKSGLPNSSHHRDCLIHVSAGYVDFYIEKQRNVTQVQVITVLRVKESESKWEASGCQKTNRNIWDREVIKESVDVQ